MKKIIFVAFLISIMLPSLVLADLGPKPSISLKFTGNTSNISSVKLLGCTDQTCVNKKQLENLGPQSFTCNYGRNISCYSMSYGYANYLQLESTISKKIIYSNVFSTNGAMDSYFRATATKNSLSIEKITGVQYDEEALNEGEGDGIINKSTINEKMSIFLLSLIITIIIELLVGIIYLLIKKTRVDNSNLNNNTQKIIIFWILLINLITLPLLWLSSNYINLNYYIFTLIAEVVVIILESIFIFAVMKKTIPYTELLALSLVMNAASFFLGNYISKIIG